MIIIKRQDYQTVTIKNSIQVKPRSNDNQDIMIINNTNKDNSINQNLKPNCINENVKNKTR